MEMVNEQVDYLKRLYASISPDLQREFTSELEAQLDERNAPIVAQTLLEFRDTLGLYYWQRFDETALNFWSAIADKVALEHWYFTDEDLDRIESGLYRLRCQLDSALERHRSGNGRPEEIHTVGRASEVFADVQRVLDRVRYLRIGMELQGIRNPAIDTDRRTLLSRLETLGFPSKLSEALNEVERRGLSAVIPLDFKAAMDLLRGVLESFTREAAVKVAAKNSRPLPSADKLQFAPWKDYLRDTDIVTIKEEELLQKLYNYLSTEGAHQLGTGAEQLNVTRVMVIEMCMMIAGRVEHRLRS